MPRKCRSEKKDHESSPNDRDDAKVDQACEKPEKSGKQAELSTVAHLKKLSEGHGTGLPKPVDDKTRDCHQEGNRGGNGAPPAHRETRGKEDLEHGNVDDCPGSLLGTRSANEVASRGATPCQEVGDRPDIAPRVKSNRPADKEGNGHYQPIDGMHVTFVIGAGRRKHRHHAMASFSE
jgi:hypothetical protein